VTVLLEREPELAELQAGAEAAAAGRGGAVGIEALAGLGKTHLLREARTVGSAAGLTVLAARATELEREFPFALARQLFDPALRGLTDAEREKIFAGAGAARGALGLEGDSDHDTFAVLHGLYWVTAALAGETPLLLAVDDVHWADPASLEFLGFLLPRLEELPLLLVMTCRVDELEKPPGLDRLLTDSSVRHLSLAPLSPQATAKLLTEELEQAPDDGFADTCHEVSGGNPYLLTELMRTLAEQGVKPSADQVDLLRELAPESVARLVLARLGRLPAEAAKVARSVAVLGEDCDYRLVAELAQTGPEAVQRASDLLRTSGVFDRGSSLRFVHPLVRNAIYADLSAGERMKSHWRAAALLRDHDASVEQIATQLLAGEVREERATVETLLEAGELALTTGAPRSAVAYLTRALREPPPDELRATVLDRLITASFRAADPSPLPMIEADVSREVENQPSLRARWAVSLTMLMALQGRFEEAAVMLKGAVEVAVAEGDMERAFQLEAHLATLALVVPSLPKVNLEPLVGQIDPDSPAGRLAAAMEVRFAAVNGTAADVVAAAKRALANDAVIFAEEPDLVSSALSVMALVAADELEVARHGASRALALAEEGDANPPQLVRGWFLRGFVAWGHGDLVEAEADLRQAVALARMAGIMPLVMMHTPILAEILIERDDLEAAEAELQGLGMASGPLPVNPISGGVLMARGHLHWERGEFGLAAEDFVGVSVIAEELGLGVGPVASVAPFNVQALIAIEKREQAEDLAKGLIEWARDWGAPASISHQLRADAFLRDGDERIETLQEAVAILDGSPRLLQRLHALTDLGAALRAAGRRSDARAPLREALQLARRCGALRAARRARDELQATGETVRRFAPIGVESLTPSERRVAELAATGLTNREIAQTLFVTVKTVEAHLSAAYDKLDIDSRRKLATALANSNGFGAEGA
jgi:DNA-binding CsgD family transcriptional regulator